MMMTSRTGDGRGTSSGRIGSDPLDEFHMRPSRTSSSQARRVVMLLVVMVMAAWCTHLAGVAATLDKVTGCCLITVCKVLTRQR